MKDNLDGTAVAARKRAIFSARRILAKHRNLRCFGHALLAYATGTVNQELLLRSEYLAAENRI